MGLMKTTKSKKSILSLACENNLFNDQDHSDKGYDKYSANIPTSKSHMHGQQVRFQGKKEVNAKKIYL